MERHIVALQITKQMSEIALQQLKKLLEGAKSSSKLPESWMHEVRIALKRLYPNSPHHVVALDEIQKRRVPFVGVSTESISEQIKLGNDRKLQQSCGIVEAAIKEFETYGIGSQDTKTSHRNVGSGSPKKLQIDDQIVADDEIFIVHGHDEEMKQSVARTLSSLDLKPIILHEQANHGRTIIEKFEANSNVGFAVVLLSPDDMVYSAKKDHTTAKPHARPNVILELGFFVGRIGRERVFALKRGDTVVPSDFSGVVYTDYDSGGAWRLTMAKELRAIGYDIDFNNL